MFCNRYTKLLIPYLDGTLDEAARRKVEAHLARCESCAQELRVVRSISGVLKAVDAPVMEPAHDLWAKVSARIETEQPAPTPRGWLRTTQAVSACVVTVLLAAVGIGMFLPNAPEPMTPSTPVVRPETVPAPADEPEPREPASPTAGELYAKAPSAPSHSPLVANPSVRPKPAHTKHLQPLSYDHWHATRDAKQVPPPAPRKEDYAWKAAVDDRGPTSGTERPGFADFARRGVETSATQPPPTSRTDGLIVAGDTAGVAVASAEGAKSERYFAVAASEAAPAETHASLGLVVTTAPGRPASAPSAASPETPADASFGTLSCAGRPRITDEVGVAKVESVVDTLNETEGVRVVALFAYP